MVEARTQASAISHVAKGTFKATPISTKEAVAWAGKGVALEDPKDGDEPETETSDK